MKKFSRRQSQTSYGTLFIHQNNAKMNFKIHADDNEIRRELPANGFMTEKVNNFKSYSPVIFLFDIGRIQNISSEKRLVSGFPTATYCLRKRMETS